MSATLASSFAARHNALVPLTLGHSANAIELLLVPIAPDVHNATDLKARAFDFLSDLLCQHAEQYSSAELIAACNHIPGSSYNANQEATTICSSLHAAFFTTTNLTHLAFCDNRGGPITSPITVDPATHIPGISYFVFRSTVDPTTADSRITRRASSITIGFWLALPQTIFFTPEPATDHARHILQQRFDSTPASLSQASATSPLRKTDLDALSADELALLGTKASNDTLSDYAPDYYPMFFTPLQIQILLLRTVLPAPLFPPLPFCCRV